MQIYTHYFQGPSGYGRLCFDLVHGFSNLTLVAGPKGITIYDRYSKHEYPYDFVFGTARAIDLLAIAVCLFPRGQLQ